MVTVDREPKEPNRRDAQPLGLIQCMKSTGLYEVTQNSTNDCRGIIFPDVIMLRTFPEVGTYSKGEENGHKREGVRRQRAGAL